MICIKINNLGRVVNGEMNGWYIIIKDDLENTGGYLVILFEDNKFNGKGYDNWFLTHEKIEQYLLDNKIDIEWIDSINSEN